MPCWGSETGVDRSVKVRAYAERLRVRYPHLSRSESLFIAERKVKY